MANSLLTSAFNTLTSNQPTINTDYGRFRTPFRKIEVGDSSGNNMQELPPDLYKLVEKIEIIETLSSGTCLYNHQIAITFIEGSREPLQTDSDNENAFYKTSDTSSLNNRVGLIPDLIFQPNGSIGFLKEVGSLIAQQLPSINSLQSLSNFTPSLEDINIISGTANATTNFVFKEGNFIKVTFGYIEDPDNQRAIMSPIKLLETEFPDNDQPRTTITCIGLENSIDKISTPIGKSFSIPIPTGISETGQPLFNYQDQSIGQIISSVLPGIKTIISNKFLAPLLDKHSIKVWAAGESFYQFMQKQASRMNAYTGVVIDAGTHEEVFFFISKEDYNNSLIITDPNFFNFKQPGSILKNVHIRADFGNMSGVMGGGVNDNGKPVYQGYNKLVATPIAQGEAVMDLSENNKISQIVSSNTRGGQAVGKVFSSPEANTPGALSDRAASYNNCGYSKIIGLEFTCLGYPLLFPGPIKIGNIGTRYSGVYNVLSVTHTLDASGYVCKGSATSMSLVGGGVTSDGTTVQQPSPAKVNVGITSAISNAFSSEIPGATTSPRDQLTNVLKSH